MRLQELTPAEIAFLSASPDISDGLQARLTQRLAATLTARLRLPVRLHVQPAGVSEPATAVPRWQPDTALAALWLTRRLGGRRVTGGGAFVPRTLIHALDAALAECWLDAAAPASLPAALAWTITTDLAQATLAVALPQHTNDMTRWAREVIRHGY
jgi:hypothetical protein